MPQDNSLELEEALDDNSLLLLGTVLQQNPTTAAGSLPSSSEETNSTTTEASGEAHIDSHEDKLSEKPTTGVNVGVVVAVLAVLALIVLITVGVLKEHRFIRFQSWRLLQAGERDRTVGVKPSGTTTQRDVEKERKKKRKLTPKKKLQSLLGPSSLGFSRLKTYDSNSEDEDFPVFNRV